MLRGTGGTEFVGAGTRMLVWGWLKEGDSCDARCGRKACGRVWSAPEY